MNKQISRRRFMFAASAGGVAVFGSGLLSNAAADMAAVDPSAPQAQALGYVVDATTTDTAKFARYEAGQECVNCQLYQGTADSESGGCLLFAGQAVAAKGWCNSWVKKAG